MQVPAACPYPGFGRKPVPMSVPSRYTLPLRDAARPQGENMYRRPLPWGRPSAGSLISELRMPVLRRTAFPVIQVAAGGRISSIRSFCKADLQMTQLPSAGTCLKGSYRQDPSCSCFPLPDSFYGRPSRAAQHAEDRPFAPKIKKDERRGAAQMEDTGRLWVKRVDFPHNLPV